MAEVSRSGEGGAVTLLQTSISSIEQDVLRYRGVSIGELVANATFEEVVWLLWTGNACRDSDRDQFFADIATGAAVPEAVWAIVHSLPRDTPTAARMQVALPLLELYVPEFSETSDLPEPRMAARLIGAFTTLAANLLNESHAAPSGSTWPGAARVFLSSVLRGEPSPEAVRALGQVFTLYADHELNASTFAARVTASTRADLLSAVLAALSTLRGPLHGGIERVVQAMLAEAETEGAEALVERYGRARVHMPGFGHAVYRAPDPRGVIMHDLARELAPAAGQEHLLDIAESIEMEAARRGVPPANVDFYSTVVYRSLGIPDALCPLVFATGRLAGWCAHIMEQHERNRLIRPRATYAGPPSRRWRDVQQA